MFLRKQNTGSLSAEFARLQGQFGRKNEKVLDLQGLFGTPSGNRTHNLPLGGAYYIHLTMEADLYLVELTSFDKIKKVIGVSKS